MAHEFLWTRRVEFADTDLAGVLHFANYYKFMEAAEHAYWRSMGLCVLHQDGERELSWPRVATSCEYFAPARFEDELELAVTVDHVGDRSVTYEIQFRREGECIARGRITAVCCTMVNGAFQPVSIPGSLRLELERPAASSS